MAAARSIPATSTPAARVRGGSRAPATPTMPSSKSLYRPLALGRRMNRIAPAEQPTGRERSRWAPSGMAQRSWRAAGGGAGAPAGCRGGMGGHASGRAPPGIAWRPTMGGTRASLSREPRSMRSAVRGGSPRLHRPPCPCRWRPPPAVSQSATRWTGSGSNGWSERPTQASGRRGTRAWSSPRLAWSLASSRRRGRTNAPLNGHGQRSRSAWGRPSPDSCRRWSGRPSRSSRTPCRPSGLPPRRQWRSGKRVSGKSSHGGW